MVELSDWTNFAEFNQSHYVDTEYSFSNPGALRVENLNKQTEATVYQPSLNSETNNASVEGRVETMIRPSNNIYFGMYLRFIDLQNHYAAIGGEFYTPSEQNQELRLFRTVDGETELVNQVSFDTFSDGTRITEVEEKWIPFRVTWFTDDMNGYRIWVQEDANGDGEWEDVGGTLVDPNPSLGPNDTTTGSGIGFGGLNEDVDFAKLNSPLLRNGLWFDDTELYYETS